jgi:hypothetical protein
MITMFAARLLSALAVLAPVVLALPSMGYGQDQEHPNQRDRRSAEDGHEHRDWLPAPPSVPDLGFPNQLGLERIMAPRSRPRL